MDSNETCDACGARTAPDLDWCPRCYAPTVPPRQETLPPIRMWYPEEPVPDPVYSRWRGGTTTFGPIGRIGWTLGVSSVGAIFWMAFGPRPPFGFGIGSSAWAAYVFMGGWILRNIWRRDRVR